MSVATIVSQSTPSGFSAIAIIRLSGPKATNIVAKISSTDVALKHQKAELRPIYIKKKLIDEAIFTAFISPRSYTGEDIVEISCHGSPFIQQSIIQLLLSKNCRIANAGEFTMRSFLNGKMDLSQAESVADLISSTSESSHKIAMDHMRGGFSNDIKLLREELLNFASLIELVQQFLMLCFSHLHLVQK